MAKKSYETSRQLMTGFVDNRSILQHPERNKTKKENENTSAKLAFSLILGGALYSLILVFSGFAEGVSNSSFPNSGHGVLQSFFVQDACSSSSLRTKTQCCASTNYPVLGGVDVVALKEVHKGNPPVLGALEHAAALPTSYGTYIFFFSNKANQQKFMEDPWRYAPKWGGFDGWEIAQNPTLKGDSAKTALGMNTDLSNWLVTMDGKAIMFGNGESKQGFVHDMDHWESKADERWIGWWGSEKDGPFNTLCFQGMDFDELKEASKRYETGELTLGADGVRDSYLKSVDRKELKNAIPTAQVFFANSEDQQIQKFFIEEGSQRGFALENVLPESQLQSLGANSVAVALDSEDGFLYIADRSQGHIKRIKVDGQGAPEVFVSELDSANFPFTMQWSSANKLLYFADRTSIKWINKEGTTQGTLLLSSEAIQAITVSNSHLFFVSSPSNQIYRVPLESSEVPFDIGDWELVTSSDLGDISMMATSLDNLYFVVGDNAVFQSSFSSMESDGEIAPSQLFVLENSILGLDAAGSYLYWATMDSIFAADIEALQLSGLTAAVEVFGGLPQVPRSLKVSSWSAPAGLTFSVNTKYTKRGDEPVFNEYPWASGPIVEPYLPSTLSVEDPASDMIYEWVYHGKVYKTKNIQLTLKKTGEYPIALREVDPLSEAVIRELRTFLVCKYVRREIRTLTDDDREAFFQGMEVMIKISQEEGLERYGPEFKNNEYFVHMHNVLAGARDCDHLHQGKGFLNNHLGITLQFEQSLQLINPALSMPYWDYTIDNHDVKVNHGGDLDKIFETSLIFSPDWFGDAHNEAYTVTEGRWAWALKIPDDQWDNQRRNSYGMMRAPWNNNPNPYVQRFDQMAGSPVWNYNDGWPTCQDHYEVSVAHPVFVEYMARLPGWPHGTIHGVLGGSLNYDHHLDLLENLFSEKDVENIRGRSPHIPKDMWRKGLTECPDYCSSGTPMEECKCTCPQEKLAAMENDEDLFQMYVEAALNARMMNNYDIEDLKKGIQIVCNAGIIIGEQEESASPADPIFWPIHPTVERLYQWKLLNGGFEDNTWPKEGNYNAPIWMGTIQMCGGHNPNDMLPWKIALDGHSAQTFTNIDLRNRIDPTTNYQLPYVYDNFNWDHCMEEGFDFAQIGWKSV